MRVSIIFVGPRERVNPARDWAVGRFELPVPTPARPCTEIKNFATRYNGLMLKDILPFLPHIG